MFSFSFWKTTIGRGRDASDHVSLGSVVTVCSLFSATAGKIVKRITAAEFRSRLHRKASCLLLSCTKTLGEDSAWSGNRGRSGSIPSSSCHRDRSGRVPHHGRARDPVALFLPH